MTANSRMNTSPPKPNFHANPVILNTMKIFVDAAVDRATATRRHPVQLLGGMLCLAAALAHAEPVRVHALPLAELEVPIEYSSPATVVSLNETQISAELAARVVDITVLEGDIVPQGATLVRLDCRDYDLALTRAQGDLTVLLAREKLARQQLARAESLARTKNISEELLDQRRTEAEAASAEITAQRATVTGAETQVSRCAITSPYRAAVVKKLASLGDLARVGTPLLTIVDLESIEVNADVVPSEVRSLRQATHLAFTFEGERFALRLRKVSPVIDAMSHTQQARLAFAGGQPPVGASGRLLWTASLPGVRSDLLVQRGDALGVFVVKDGIARFTPITGALEGRPAVADLPKDTLIVTEGRQRLRDGEAVIISD